MGDARIVVDPGWRGHFGYITTVYLRRLGRVITDEARALVPVNTGRLRESLDWEVTGKKLTVGSRNVNYAKDVEFGTSPHIIRARNTKALYWPGARHPVRQVNHPGTRSQPYLRPALWKRRGRLGGEID